MANRRKFTAKFKKKVVLEALSERYTAAELAQRHKVHPQQVTTWKKHFLANAESVFEKKNDLREKEKTIERDSLLRTIGQLKVENDFLKKTYDKVGKRKTLISGVRPCSIEYSAAMPYIGYSSFGDLLLGQRRERAE